MTQTDLVAVTDMFEQHVDEPFALVTIPKNSAVAKIAIASKGAARALRLKGAHLNKHQFQFIAFCLQSADSPEAKFTWESAAGDHFEILTLDIRITEYKRAIMVRLKPVKKTILRIDDYTLAGAAFGLTKREIQVLELVAIGLSNSEIAAKLHIAYDTARSHISKIYLKLEVSGRVEAINRIRPHLRDTLTA